MKEWIVSDCGKYSFWLTRIEVLPNGNEDYICGNCDGPLEDHVVGFFTSSKDTPGSVACSICCKCNEQIGEHEAPSKELSEQIELLLNTKGRA